jgi:hypothetical protein
METPGTVQHLVASSAYQGVQLSLYELNGFYVVNLLSAHLDGLLKVLEGEVAQHRGGTRRKGVELASASDALRKPLRLQHVPYWPVGGVLAQLLHEQRRRPAHQFARETE